MQGEMDSIERQPHLITPTLHLRPLLHGDWDALYAVASDPAIWALHPAHDRWREPVFHKFFQQALDSGGALVAIDPAQGEIIGCAAICAPWPGAAPW